MISKTTQWKVCFTDRITMAHRRWFEGGKVGEGRIELEEKNLTRATLIKNLTGARFARCNWSNSIVYSNLTEAEITECIWNNSLLNGIRFDRASIENCTFIDSYLGTAHFIEAKVKGGDWRRCDLNKSTWTDAVVENVCFKRANFGEAKFHGSRFVNCDLRGANFESATLRGAVFENCDFRGAYLDDFVFEKVTFINCGFHGCIGIPAFEGEHTFISPDLSAAFDGTGIAEPEQLLEQWQSQDTQSQLEITLSPANSPQWLNYLSRENRAKQVRWVSAGMNGSPPMDVQGKEIMGAFAYRAYFRAARFTDCDFTASDLRRSQVQQAEFINCTFNDALLMYLEGTQKTSLDVETTKVIFQDCTARGAYLNRSEFWVAEFAGGNWDGSFFNNCIWTLAECHNVSFENTDWRNAKLDTVKFVNCNFRNALFDEAIIRSIEFINCDFRGADFGFTNGNRVVMDGCGFCNAEGMLFDIESLKDGEARVKSADLSSNFDGSLVFESLAKTEDLFHRIDSSLSDEEEDFSRPSATSKQQNEFPNNQSEELMPEAQPEPNINSAEAEKSDKLENVELKDSEQLQQELNNDKQQLKELRSQLKQVEERIKQARKTNIFGRKQSGENERQKDKLTQEIEDIKSKIAENEVAIQDFESE